MYNREQKLQYIEENKEGKKAFENQMKLCFENTEMVENKYSKDVSVFTVPEIIESYKSLRSNSYNRLLNVYSQLKRYAQWCVEKGIINESDNHHPEVGKEDLVKCIKKGDIITRERLLDEIKILANVSDQFLILALFEGLGNVGFKDLIKLTDENFVRRDGEYVVILDRGPLTISKELSELAIKSADEEVQYIQTEGLDFKDTRRYLPSEVKYIIKNASNSYANTDISRAACINNRLRRIELFLDISGIDQYSLRESGRVDYIKRLMEKDQTDNPVEIVKKYASKIEYRYGKINNIQKWVEAYAEDLK